MASLLNSWWGPVQRLVQSYQNVDRPSSLRGSTEVAQSAGSRIHSSQSFTYSLLEPWSEQNYGEITYQAVIGRDSEIDYSTLYLTQKSSETPRTYGLQAALLTGLRFAPPTYPRRACEDLCRAVIRSTPRAPSRSGSSGALNLKTS